MKCNLFTIYTQVKTPSWTFDDVDGCWSSCTVEWNEAIELSDCIMIEWIGLWLAGDILTIHWCKIFEIIIIWMTQWQTIGQFSFRIGESNRMESIASFHSIDIFIFPWNFLQSKCIEIISKKMPDVQLRQDSLSSLDSVYLSMYLLAPQRL